MAPAEDPNKLRKEGWGARATERFGGAIYKFKRAGTLFHNQKKWRDYLQVLKGEMLCYSAMGNREEALKTGKNAYAVLKKYSSSIDPEEKAKFLHNYSITLSKDYQYEKALKLANTAEPLADKDFLPKIQQAKANCLMYLDKFDKALEYFNKALESAKGTTELYLKEQKASCLHRMGDYTGSVRLLRQVVRKRNEQNIPRDWTYFHLASSLKWLGKDKEAYENFKKAAQYIDSLVSLVTDTEYRKTFFAQKMEIYNRLIRTAADRGEAKEAYFYVRAAKGKIFREEILKNAVGPKEMKKEKELRQEMKELVREENASASKLKKIERQYRGITDKLKEKGGFASVFRDPLPIKDIKETLKNREAVVEFYALPGKLLVFVITKSFFKLFVQEITAYEVGQFCSNLLNLTKRKSRPSDFRWYSRKFYTKILKEPLERLKRYNKLIFIPHTNLHTIPFGALFTDKGEPLINKFIVSYISSPLLLKIIRERKAKGRKNFLGVANPGGDLPETEKEVQNAAGYFKNRKILRRSRATFNTVTKYIKSCSHAHFGCHSIFNKEYPMDSEIKLHPLKNGPDALKARDILNLDLKHVKLVVLSSCSSALGKTDHTDDYEGLARSFLIAGAGSLAVTLWEIGDSHTKELMKIFYSEMDKKKEPAEALQRAMQIFSGKHPSPFYWSPFKLIG